MEAYDAAVLSYALASAGKLKPGVLGIGAPNISGPPQDVSLTPPHPGAESAKLLNSLSAIDQSLTSKAPVGLAHLLDLCSHKQVPYFCTLLFLLSLPFETKVPIEQHTSAIKLLFEKVV